MTEQDIPPGRCPDAEPSIATRQQALTDALKARRTPEPDREFSTLVERSEPAQTACEASSATDVRHEVDCSCQYGRKASPAEEAGYERLLVELERTRHAQLLAEGQNPSCDEAEDENGAVPNPPACAQENEDDAADQK